MDIENNPKQNNGGNFMTTTARKWGNGIGIRIPKSLADKHGVSDGVKISVKETNDGDGILLSTIPKKPTLEELVSKCTPEDSHKKSTSEYKGRELL